MIAFSPCRTNAWRALLERTFRQLGNTGQMTTEVEMA
jgi:hypothetical protein